MGCLPAKTIIKISQLYRFSKKQYTIRMAEKDILSPLMERIAANVAMHRGRSVTTDNVIFPLATTDPEELEAVVPELLQKTRKTIIFPLQVTENPNKTDEVTVTQYDRTKFKGIWLERKKVYLGSTQSSLNGNHGSDRVRQTYSLVGITQIQKAAEAAEIEIPKGLLPVKL